jgi:hypothetical protein
MDRHVRLRLSLARCAAWALLLSGWVGLGSFAMVLAPDVTGGFALVAVWLLLLGAAASAAPRAEPRAWTRRLAMAACAVLTVTALALAPRGGGLAALGLALAAWAALTALASGVVRSLRQRQPTAPLPPIGAAAAGALCAAIALGDPSDLHALAQRLGLLVALATALLVLLQPTAARGESLRRCRAGLFDCSLPAWPAGSWRDPLQWPALLAGLAMLPMMATLPLMVAWCRGEAIAPQAIVALHLAAMFAPALLLQRRLASWSLRRLSAVCAACLVAGALLVLWADAPWNLLGLAAAHGAAWGLAWAGQLWAPDRRSRAGASPWRAALGYALLTLAVGMLVARFGVQGMAGVHVALGLAAAAAGLTGLLLNRRGRPWRAPARPVRRTRCRGQRPPSHRYRRSARARG